MIYAGVWNCCPSDASSSGGQVTESMVANSTATLPFNGTGVSWIGFKGDFGGIAQVFLDGTLVATVDTFAPIRQPQVVMYTASGLPAGPHTLTIKVTGTTSADAFWVVVDAFDVTS